MKMKKFLLEIVTPERVAFSENVELVTVPSAMGELGILANHTPLFAKLTDGEVKIRKDDEDFFLSIGGGFLEITPKKTSVLVTKAVRVEELNEEAILKAKKQAEEALIKRPSKEEIKVAQTLLRSTLIDLKVLRRRRKYREITT